MIAEIKASNPDYTGPAELDVNALENLPDRIYELMANPGEIE